MELKTVIVSKMVPKQCQGTSRMMYVLEPAGEALFHQFGVGYEEFENGPGNFTTAVVEWPSGQLENVPVQHVQFVKPNAGLNRPGSRSEAEAGGSEPKP